MIKLNSRWILYFAILLAMILRCIKFGDIPTGYNIDECGSAVDAYYIAHHGTDRYGINYPVYFINYGQGQSAMFTYLCALSVYFFGINEFSIRLPMLIASCLLVIFGMKLVGIIWCDRYNIKTVYAQILFVVIYAITPYCFMASRFGLDCNLMFSMSTIFLYFFISAIKERSNLKFFVSGISAGLVLYTYAVSYVVMPIFLIMTLTYLCWLRRINLHEVIYFAVPLVILAIPLLLVQYMNIFGNELIMRIGIFSITKIPYYRVGELTLSNILQNVCLVFKSTFAYDEKDYNTIETFWTFYHVSIIFAAIGLAICARRVFNDLVNKNFSEVNIIFIWFLAVLILGAMLGKHNEIGINPNTNKINGIFISAIIFIIFGIIRLYVTIINQKIKKFFMLSLTMIYFVYSILFFNYYFQYYQPKNFIKATDEDVNYVINEIGIKPSYPTDFERVNEILLQIAKKYNINND